jgi:hypothetical protein
VLERVDAAVLVCAPHHVSFYRSYGFAPFPDPPPAGSGAMASALVGLHAGRDDLPASARERCRTIATFLSVTGEACTCVAGLGPGAGGGPPGDAGTVCAAYAVRRLRAMLPDPPAGRGENPGDACASPAVG